MPALPYPIANGQTPSGVKLQANFAYLLALISSGAMPIDTYANLRATAALAPTTPFACVATDQKLYLLYCGDVTVADGGFITLASWTTIS